MTGNEYQKLAMRTNDGNCTFRLEKAVEEVQRFRGDTGMDIGGVLNACLGLSGEVGETNDMIKKWIFHGHVLDENKLAKELGDILWYVAMMCHSLGWNIEEIMQMNIEKLKARYPEGFSEEASIHRKE